MDPPDRWVSQVSIIGANPPKKVNAPLYTKDIPVERTPVGKISDNAAGATPTKLATNMHTIDWTMMSVNNVGSAFNQRNNGHTKINSRAALMKRLVRRPMRSERDPNQTQPTTKGTLPIKEAPKACLALKLNVSGCCT